MARPLVLSLLAMCLSLNVQSQIADSLEVKTETLWKSLDEIGYGIQYPDNWDVDTSGQMGMSFIIFSRQTSPQDSFRENVNLLIQDLTGLNINIDAFVKISEDQVTTMYKEGKIHESKRIKNQAKNFHKLVYSGSQGPFVLKTQQYYWVENDKAYILTLTCEAAQFDSYIQTGDKIMNSFVLK
jgi:hypothetical protein